MKALAAKFGFIGETADVLGEYWFAFGSPTAMGLFRIAIGFFALLDLFFLSFDWSAWFGQAGFMPSWLSVRWLGPHIPVGFGTKFAIPRLDLLSGVVDNRITIAFFWLTAIAAVLTTLGLWTRVSSIALAVGIVSIHHRNAVILHGGDTVLRIAVLYVAIAPSGASCSLDRLIGLLKGKLLATPVLVSMWPQRLIAYNVALIYLTTTWNKWGGHNWENGTATYYPSRLPEFYRFPVPHFFNDFPFVYITTYGVLFTEFAMGTLVFFKPLRKYVLGLGLLMHAYIEYSMNIPLFSFLITSMYIAFYEGDEIAGWAKRWGNRLPKWRVTAKLPMGMRLRPNVAAFLDAADPFKLVSYSQSEGPEWEAATQSGVAIPISKALRSRCPGCWPFGWNRKFWDRFMANALEPKSLEEIAQAAQRPKAGLRPKR